MRKTRLLISWLGIGLVFIISSCKQDTSNIKEKGLSVSDSSRIEFPEIKRGNFYTENIEKGNSIVLADTIIYYTVIKNANQQDEWQEKCLERLDRKALANIIFNAIYNGRLTPYDFMTEEPMTINEVKSLEKDNPRNKIAKVEFTEEWYFNEDDLSFTKRVNAIMLGYEKGNNPEDVKYVAGVKVYLSGVKKKVDIK